MHANLVIEPIQGISRHRHVVAFAVLILMCDHVHHRIQTVNVRPHAHCRLFNAGIYFRNDLDLRVHRLRLAPNLVHKIRKCLDPKIHPFTKISIAKISELQIFLRI